MEKTLVREEQVVNEFWMYPDEPYRVWYRVYSDGSVEYASADEDIKHSAGVTFLNARKPAEWISVEEFFDSIGKHAVERIKGLILSTDSKTINEWYGDLEKNDHEYLDTAVLALVKEGSVSVVDTKIVPSTN